MSKIERCIGCPGLDGKKRSLLAQHGADFMRAFDANYRQPADCPKGPTGPELVHATREDGEPVVYFDAICHMGEAVVEAAATEQAQNEADATQRVTQLTDFLNRRPRTN
jgi:hypothetical protein